MPQFADTELILNAHNRVYHLDLANEHIADNVIVVGDQNRVQEVSSRFSTIEFKAAHREFITHTGFFEGNRITVMSTGIGTDNIDIVMNELDAAVNIDPITRTLKPERRKLNIYRLGTCGALQEDLPVDSIVVSSHAIGLDGLLNFYEGWQTHNINTLSQAFINQMNWDKRLAYPYCADADAELLNVFKEGFYKGITATAPGFYAPQGRQLRLKPSNPYLNEKLASFSYGHLKILNFEMETSALYGLGKLLQHRCLSLCVVIANRVRKEFSSNTQQSVSHLITSTLHKITQHEPSTNC